MRRYMISISALALLFGAVAYNAPSAAAEPAGLWVERIAIPGDSIRYVARWSPPELGPQHRELAGYDVEWVFVPEGVPFAAGSPTDPVHTFETIEPPEPVGPMVVRVRTRDVSGGTSEWQTSPEWFIEPEYMAPPPPGIPEIEGPDGQTIAWLKIVPDVVSVDVGADVQLCGVVRWSDGAWGVSPQLPLCEARMNEMISRADAPQS